MRAISPTTLAKLESREPVQSYIELVTTFGSFSELNQGSILELSNLDSVQNVSGSGNNSTVSVKLSDTTNVLRDLINTTDIHKTRVKIYQCFVEVTDKFLLFEGIVSSPVVWNEGDRSLSFDIISRLEDNEVGFAPEDGLFNYVREDMIGKAWPLCFGTNKLVPVQQLNRVPAAILKDPFGFPDPGLYEQKQRFIAQRFTAQRLKQEAEANAQLYAFYAGLAGASGDTQSSETYSDMSVEQQERATELGDEMMQLTIEITGIQSLITAQRNFFRSSVQMYCDQGFPQGPLSLKIGEHIFTGVSTLVDPEQGLYTFVFKPAINPDAELSGFQFEAGNDLRIINVPTSGAEKHGFQFFNSGSQITIVSPFDIEHIICCNAATVERVYAYRNYNGLRRLTQVPSEYYTIVTDDAQGWFQPTRLVLAQPLSQVSYYENLTRERLDTILAKVENTVSSVVRAKINTADEWEDELFVDIESVTGPNIIDVMKWIIDNFTTLTYDEDSFALAFAFLAAYPAHFMLFEKKNVVQVLNEMAYQARCALWINDEVFYIKYLPHEPASIATFTEDDIEHNSLEIFCSDTEELVTKTINTWRADYLDGVDNKIILKYNDLRYGLKTEEHDYYIFNIHAQVKKSASFWLMRTSHTWKKIRFRTFLHKMHVEAHDTVTINFTHNPVADTSVNGIVESSVYDSSNNTVEVEVWLPVLWGKMVVYDFAFPADIAEESVIPLRQDVFGGSGGGVSFTPSVTVPHPNGTDTGERVLLSDEYPGGNPVLSTDPVNAATLAERGIHRTIVTDSNPRTHPADAWDLASVVVKPKVLTPVDPDTPVLEDYTLRDRVIDLGPSEVPPPSAAPSAYPGTIVSGTGNVYVVELIKGVDEEGDLILENETVSQMQIASGSQLPAGTKCIVVKIGSTYYMQVPVWLYLEDA
jgi:hypothetical protein